MVKETVIYIHGVSGDAKGSHGDEYEALHAGILAHLPKWPQDKLGVEWGWFPPSNSTPRSHELLTRAQHVLGTRTMEAAGAESDFTLNPLRIAVNQLRPLFIFNLSDMIYYVSTQGKNAVRLAFAQQLVKHLAEEILKPEPLISLTLLGHSAGSVIAFDMLFYLFYPGRRQEDFIQPAATPDGAAAVESAPGPGVAKTLNDLQKLRALAERKRLRVRRLVTFGSPITPLAVRSDAVLKILAAGGSLSPAWHGLTANEPIFGKPLQGPRWINIWDKDDPIAWPAEPLMTAAGGVVKDYCLDVSDSPKKAHGAYWESEEVHQLVAERW